MMLHRKLLEVLLSSEARLHDVLNAQRLEHRACYYVHL